MSKNINKNKSPLQHLKTSKDFMQINFKKSKDEFPMLTNYKKNNFIGNVDFQNENNPTISIYRSSRKKENIGSNSLIKLGKDNWPNWKEKLENNIKNVSSFKIENLYSDNYNLNNPNLINNTNDLTNNNSILFEINSKFSQNNLKLQLSNKKNVQNNLKNQPKSMKNLDAHIFNNKKDNNNNDFDNNDINNANVNFNKKNNNINNNKNKFDNINNKEILMNSNSLKLPQNFLKFDSELFSNNPLKTLDSQKKDINSRINTESKFK
jgi:hypothetical protein